MNNKLQQSLDEAFKPYGDFPARKDVEQELLANLSEKFDDLKAEGESDVEAYRLATELFGDVSEIMENIAHDEHASGKRGADKSIIQNLKDFSKSGDTRLWLQS